MTSGKEPTLDAQLGAIADPVRRTILRLLRQRGGCSLGKSAGMCACDVEAATKLSQPTISHHMRILTQAGLVNAQRLGKWRWYRRDEIALRKLTKALAAEL